MKWIADFNVKTLSACGKKYLYDGAFGKDWCTRPQSKAVEHNYWEKAGCPGPSFKDSSGLLGIRFRQLLPGTGVFLLLLKFECNTTTNKNNNIFFFSGNVNFQNKMDVLTFAVKSCKSMCFQKLCAMHLPGTVCEGATCRLQLGAELPSGWDLQSRWPSSAHPPFLTTGFPSLSSWEKLIWAMAACFW